MNFLSGFKGAVGEVVSVFGRTGAVVATTGDYTIAQITNGAAGTQLQSAALGVKYEPFSPLLTNSVVTPASQIVFGVLIGCNNGAVITGVKMRNQVAAAGTSPTTARFGIASAAGVVAAVSANVNTAASWPAGVMTVPFSAPYTIPADGGYFACFVVNGTWGTTQPTQAYFSTQAGAQLGPDGSNPPPAFQWSGQTDLPIVGGSLTMTTFGSQIHWMSFY